MAIEIEIELHAHRSSDEVAVELGYFAFEIHCVIDSGKTIAGPYM